MKKVLFLVLIVCFFSLEYSGAETLSKDAIKARDMVKKAQDFWKKNGKDVSLAEFSNTKGQFVDGEFYLFVWEYTLIKEKKIICLARGDGNKAMIGINGYELKDPDGILIQQGQVKVSQSKEGFGWMDYKRTNPTTKKIEPKSSYIEKIPGVDIYIGCGFYK